MPRPVLGATLWFSAAFILINGLQIVTSRMFDIRRTLVFGLALTVALAVDLYPVAFVGVPSSLAPFTGSALVLGTIVAFLLNAVFRIGVRRTGTIVIDPADVDTGKIIDFMEAQGAAWGARRDVIEPAKFSLAQSIETIAGSPTRLKARIDETMTKAHAGLERIANARLEIGMTPEQVRAIRGEPSRISVVTTPNGVREQWHYGMTVLSFADGRLVEIFLMLKGNG